MAERGEARRGASERVGERVGKWKLDSLIGVGGMAAVYAATHRTGHRVALKILHADLAFVPQVRERFIREPYIANQIQHRGRVAVLDDDVDSHGCPYFVMDLLEGESLGSWLKRPPGVAEVLWVGEQLADPALDGLLAALADVLRKQGKFDEALEYSRRRRSRPPSRPSAYW